MKKYLIGSLVACTFLSGAGFKISEQSNDGTALLNSNVATSFGPDASYYNPANMMFLDDSRHYFENSFSYLHLNKIKFTDKSGQKYESKAARAFVPTFHFVSPEYYANWRFGLSLFAPAGIAMRWDHPAAKATAQKFQLKVFEVNPTAAYRITDDLAIGFGLRALYSQGRASSEAMIPRAGATSRTLKGDGINFGYNVALTYKPTENFSLAATYRSKVMMKLKGDAKIDVPVGADYDNKARVEVPMPAALVLATSYKFKDTTFMFAYERTYWSAWKELDFNYDNATAAQNANPFFQAYDKAHPRDWKDTNSYRLGVAHDATNKLRVMAGFMYDEAASRADKTGFELPDTKSYVYSAGFNYKFSDDLEFGLAYMYQDRKAREVTRTIQFYPDGKFEKANAQIVNLGVKYKF